MPALPRCLVCGKELVDDPKFCPGCGRDLKRQAKLSPTAELLTQGVVGRELGIKETIWLSLRLYRRNFARYFLVFVSAGVAYGLLSVVLYYFIPLQSSQSTSALSDFIISPSALLQSVVFTVISSPIQAFTDGTGVSIAVDTLTREHAGLKEGYGTATGKFWRLLSVVLLTGIIVDLASIVELVSFIPEILFFVAIPVVMVENPGTLATLARSRQLVSKRWTKVFELFIVFAVIAGVPSLAIFYVFPFESPIQTMASSIYSGFVAPVFVALTTTFYYSSLARLSAPPSPVSAQPVPSGPRLWVCQNCRKSIVSSTKPKETAFGGCDKGKKSTWTVPEHNWVELGYPAPLGLQP